MLATATANSSIYARPAAPARANAVGEGPLGLIGAPMRFARNTEIYGEDEPAEYLYQVISGAVRTYRMLDDGRRQIGALLSAGRYFRRRSRRRASLLGGGDLRRADPGRQAQQP